MSEVLAQTAGLPPRQSSAGVAAPGAAPQIAIHAPFIEVLEAARAGHLPGGDMQGRQAMLPPLSAEPAAEQIKPAVSAASDLLDPHGGSSVEAAITSSDDGQSAANSLSFSLPQPIGPSAPPGEAVGEPSDTVDEDLSLLPAHLEAQTESTVGHQDPVPEPLTQVPARDAPPTPATPVVPPSAASAPPLPGFAQHARMITPPLEADPKPQSRSTASANTSSFEQQQASGQERTPGFEIIQRQPGSSGEALSLDKSPLPVSPAERLLVAAAALAEPGDDPLTPFRPTATAPSAPPAATVADAQPAGPRGTIPAVAAEMVSQLRGGNRQFEIRLDPPELGRIEVKLDFRPDGGLAAKLVVDRPETLDLLMRDARGLERSLQAGGFKLDEGALEYQLRDQPGQEHDGQRQPAGGEASSGSDDAPEEAQPQDRRRVLVRGLDIRV